MAQKEEKIQRMTPEIEAEMDAFVAEYDRKISAGECIYSNEPLEDFSDMLEKDAREGRVAKPWGWWLENKDGKTEEDQVKDL